MASKNELYAEIVNGETQRFRDEISVQGAQLADRRSREIESAAIPKEGAAIATAALNEMVKDLSEILQRGIETKAHPTFEWLRRRVSQLASPELDTPQPRREDFLLRVRHKTLIEKVLGSRRHEDDTAKAEAAFHAKFEEYSSSQEQLAQQKRQHEAKLAIISEWEQDYRRGDDAAVLAYCALIVGCCDLPRAFPASYQVSYESDSKELLINHELPPINVVPALSEFKWVEARGCTDRKARKPEEIKQIYQDVIAAVALRISFEIFRTEHLGYVSAVVFNGFVNGIDPATGHDAKPCLISVPVTRERLSSIDLRRVEKIACLRSLGAKISPAPSEMVAIESLVGFHKEAEQLVQEKTDARTVNAIDFAAKLASFLKGCEAITLRTYNVYDPTLAYTTEEGRRYVRVFLTRNSERDIHSFIDKTNGDVLKAATWKAPAKYPRGNIFDAHNGLKWMGPCGPFLLGPGAASVMC